MKVPAWVSWQGLAIHVAVGFVAGQVFRHTGTPYGMSLVAAASIGVAHEIGDRDLLPGAQAFPWNGLLDVAAFVIGAVL